MDMFTTTASKALDSAKDGTKVSWRNPDSTAHGYVIPSKTTHADGRTCRHLTIFNEVKQGKDQSAYKFCKIGGEWKIVS
jgi:surface antigen